MRVFFSGTFAFLITAVQGVYAQDKDMRLDFYGEARSEDGKLIYLEKHLIQYANKGQPLSSKTEYFDSQQKLIAELVSDYSRNQLIPDYHFEDFRNGILQGTKLQKDGQVSLFTRERKEGPTKQSILKEEPFMMGCQGWNYYLLERLDQFCEKNISGEIKLLFPGSLDAFRFIVQAIKIENNICSINIKVTNWFLRLFAPDLTVNYQMDKDPLKRKILSYKGPSNIMDQNGKTQKVTVQYFYK